MAEENTKDIISKDEKKLPMIPTDANGAYRIAAKIAKSGLVPRSMQGNVDSVFSAMLFAHELGITPMQGIANIAVVNGKAYVYGELAIALVRQSGLCKKFDVKLTGEGDSRTATAIGQRVGVDDTIVERSFSVKEAKKADLFKNDVWNKYTDDMLSWKAIHRLIKFVWADVIKGVRIRELAADDKSVLDVIDEAPEAEIMEDTTAVVLPEITGIPEKKIAKPKKKKASKKEEVVEAEPVEEEVADEPEQAIPTPEADTADYTFAGMLMGVSMLRDSSNDDVTFVLKLEVNGKSKQIKVETKEAALELKPFKGKFLHFITEKVDGNETLVSWFE